MLVGQFCVPIATILFTPPLTISCAFGYLIILLGLTEKSPITVLANQEKEQKPIALCLFSHAWQVE